MRLGETRLQRLGYLRIIIINNVAMAEHRSESFKQAVFLKDMAVEALQRIEMVTALGVVGMPHIPPAFAGAVFEPQRNNLPFPLSHHSLFSVISVSIRYITSARISDSNPLLKNELWPLAIGH